jgi:hypothetical protein
MLDAEDQLVALEEDRQGALASRGHVPAREIAKPVVSSVRSSQVSFGASLTLKC